MDHLVINFRRSLRRYGGLKSQDVEKIQNFETLSKYDPLRGYFQNSFLKVLISTPIDVLCSYFMKFGRREMGKIVRCLLTKNRLAFQLLLLRRSRPNMPGPAPEIFRRSYTRTREHHQNGL